jgi:hypothetical protein
MARVALTDAEVNDLNDLNEAVVNARTNVPCGEWGSSTLMLWLTWYSMALQNVQDAEDGGQTLPSSLTGTHYATLYSWTDRLFRQGVCYEPSSIEQDAFEEMRSWVLDMSGTTSTRSWTIASFFVGVVGLGAAGYMIWKGRKGRR